jgi:hypothetical protein
MASVTRALFASKVATPSECKVRQDFNRMLSFLDSGLDKILNRNQTHNIAIIIDEWKVANILKRTK